MEEKKIHKINHQSEAQRNLRLNTNSAKEVLVNIPVAKSNNEIRIFHSFEEAEAYDIKQMAMKDPILGMHDTVELIHRAYGISRDELKKRIPDNKIKILFYQ